MYAYAIEKFVDMHEVSQNFDRIKVYMQINIC